MPSTRAVTRRPRTTRVGDNRCGARDYPAIQTIRDCPDAQVWLGGHRRLMSSGTVLDSIIEGVRADVAVREAAVSLDEVKANAKDAASPLDVLAALRVPGIGVIAEVKRASPSRGELATISDPAKLAACLPGRRGPVISVLTNSAASTGRSTTSTPCAPPCRFRCCARTSSSGPTRSTRRGRTVRHAVAHRRRTRAVALVSMIDRTESLGMTGSSRCTRGRGRRACRPVRG